MSSVNSKIVKSSLITSSKLFFGRPIPLLRLGMLILSYLLIEASTLLLFTWPNHLSLVSLFLSSMGATLMMSNYFIPNSIHPHITTHPSNHPHLCYHQPLNPCLFHRSTLRSIQHSRSNYDIINFIF